MDYKDIAHRIAWSYEYKGHEVAQANAIAQALTEAHAAGLAEGESIRSRLDTALAGLRVRLRALDCTCDDQCDEPCPRHADQMREQNLRIATEAKLAEYMGYVSKLNETVRLWKADSEALREERDRLVLAVDGHVVNLALREGECKAKAEVIAGLEAMLAALKAEWSKKLEEARAALDSAARTAHAYNRAFCYGAFEACPNCASWRKALAHLPEKGEPGKEAKP